MSAEKLNSEYSQLSAKANAHIIINHWEVKVKSGNLFQASDQVRICFSFAFDWLGWWHEFSGPITERSN